MPNQISLLPLQADDREQFIRDNQEAFNYGAMVEFGPRDNHFEEDGEIITLTPIMQTNHLMTSSLKECSALKKDFPKICWKPWISIANRKRRIRCCSFVSDSPFLLAYFCLMPAFPTTQFRPLSFAIYKASSARLTKESMSSSSVMLVTPKLMVIWRTTT